MNVYVVKFPDGLSGHDGAVIIAADEIDAAHLIPSGPGWGSNQDATIRQIGTTDIARGVLYEIHEMVKRG